MDSALAAAPDHPRLLMWLARLQWVRATDCSPRSGVVWVHSQKFRGTRPLPGPRYDACAAIEPNTNRSSP